MGLRTGVHPRTHPKKLFWSNDERVKAAVDLAEPRRRMRSTLITGLEPPDAAAALRSGRGTACVTYVLTLRYTNENDMAQEGPGVRMGTGFSLT